MPADCQRRVAGRLVDPLETRLECGQECRSVRTECDRSDRFADLPGAQFPAISSGTEDSAIRTIYPVQALRFRIPDRPLPECGLDIQQDIDVRV